MKYFLVLVIIAVNILCYAGDHKLKIPRFVTIKSNEVNARTGPAINCPIEWIFVKKGEPVEIIAEYEQWRLVKDIKKEGGWVHLSVLSGKRSIIITDKQPVPLYKNLNKESKIIAKIHQNVRCSLNKCKGDWCLVKCKNHEGWLARKFIWGVYTDELVN